MTPLLLLSLCHKNDSCQDEGCHLYEAGIRDAPVNEIASSPSINASITLISGHTLPSEKSSMLMKIAFHGFITGNIRELKFAPHCMTMIL
jgi:hypothetical protein